MSNTPQIRFAGFTDAWEQRKFSELTEIRSASRVHKEEWQSSGVPFYRSSDVMAALNGTENEKAFISEELYEKLSAVSGKLEKGDVLVTGGGSVGKPYIVPNNEPLYTKDADLLWIKNNENLDPYFVYTFFFSPTFTDYLNSVSHVGTIAHYTITQLGETPITLPCVSEQQKIGDYFCNLDFLITLHQRKCDVLQKFKKSLLQKMFPKNGESVPEIRFAGFTDAWEQRKLGEVTESIKNGYSYKADGSREHTYKITRIESISTGVINTDKLGSSDEINESYRLQDGDILFSHINSLQYIANTALYTSNLGEIYHGMNLLNIRAKSNFINSHFLLHLLKIESNRDWFRTVAKPAVNQASISTTEVGAFEFLLPNLKEQQVIADYFDNLDTLITLHQRKLETLQKMKKSLLQKMFV